MNGPLELELVGDTDIIVRRRVDAPPEVVYRAHMEPALIARWMTGPPGWTMTECINEGRAGTSLRYAWQMG